MTVETSEQNNQDPVASLAAEGWSVISSNGSYGVGIPIDRGSRELIIKITQYDEYEGDDWHVDQRMLDGGANRIAKASTPEEAARALIANQDKIDYSDDALKQDR